MPEAFFQYKMKTTEKKKIYNYLDSLWTEASQDIPDRFFLIVKIPAGTDDI